MTGEKERSVVAELGWLLTAIAFVSMLLVVAVVRLRDGRDRTDELHAQIGRKLDILRSRGATEADREALRASEELLARWDELASDRPAHLETLSRVCAETGVVLLSLQDEEARRSADARVTSMGHRVRVAGDFRSVANFLDAIVAVEGAVSTEDVTLTGDDGDAADPIVAEAVVHWYALDDEVVGRAAAALAGEAGPREVLTR